MDQVSNQPEQPKKSRKKMWKIIAGVVIVFAIIGALMPKDETQQADTVTTPTPTATEAPSQTPTPTPSETTPAKPKPRTATDAGLTGTTAQAACDQRADAEFPYGYNPAWILGKIAERVEPDSVFLKAEAKVKNAFDAKRDIVIECTVTGTDDAPQVAEFNAY